MSYTHIYDRLRNAGLTEAGALGMMGNFECESNCEACRVQHDFSPTRMTSRNYANLVDRGLKTDEAFAGDDLGWGLAMWTYKPRKANLLKYCRACGASIANEDVQISFALKELMSPEYEKLWALLCNSNDLYTCVAAVCTQYERPAVNNIQDRINAANMIRKRLAEGTADQPSEPVEEPVVERYWPPRELCLGMSGPDVAVAQSLLWARGYLNSDTAAIYGTCTEKVVRRFQEDEHLTVDGVIGHDETWPALLALS